MGCAASAFLDDDDDRRRIIGVSASHIVSLTSSTYGILDNIHPVASSTGIPPPPPTPPPKPPSSSAAAAAAPEVINSWELMAGLLDPATPQKPHARRPMGGPAGVGVVVVLYTTTLRGVRSTFEACNAVRATLESHGVAFRERDISMDRGFREELRHRISISMSTTGHDGLCPLVPRLFVRGKHVGGAAEVARLQEEGKLAALLEGLPRARPGCDGCGGMRFLPCFDCNGSRKLRFSLPTPAAPAGAGSKNSKRLSGGGVVVVRCGECNENGLVLCPICS
ncbi:uncharacterized protein At3g28850-like [Oryza brachyantha]|uniref:Glutaredoxin domain-containing protein n=1 Tax=Oryza brachyantha TaxID=4533 RepID=J3L8Q6_ORYBR|nr:uncharacterized protein At3g28850-like [Oryza brachyantha]